MVRECNITLHSYFIIGSIFDVLQKFGPLPEPLVAKYTSQVLDALETLHENNIIHRYIFAWISCSN